MECCSPCRWAFLVILVGSLVFVALLEFTDIIPTDKKLSTYIPEDWKDRLPWEDDTEEETAAPVENITLAPTFSPIAEDAKLIIATISPTTSTSPSASPSISSFPSSFPSFPPSSSPSSSGFPSLSPTVSPSSSPTTSFLPSLSPSVSPSDSPSISSLPTITSSDLPTSSPSDSPSTSKLPSNIPSFPPSHAPSKSFSPSNHPSFPPSLSPTLAPSCHLTASLAFPNFADTYYGYSSDGMSITKIGEEGSCDYYNKNADWGCSHGGVAYIQNNQDERYNDKIGAEEANITDAFNSRFIFDVQHFFHKTNEGYYDQDHMIQSRLKIFANGERFGSYRTPKNVGQDTHLPDGSINPEYDGELKVTVECDDECNCVAAKMSQCDITAKFSFPDPIAEGSPESIHTASLSAEKEGETGICQKSNDKTNWGCAHSGTTAYYHSSSYYDEVIDIQESLTITEAYGTDYVLTVEEFLTGWEGFYYEVVPGELDVQVNGRTIELFHFANGTKNVDLSCDFGCECTATEVDS